MINSRLGGSATAGEVHAKFCGAISISSFNQAEYKSTMVGDI
jgi:hypothetical protein